MSEYEMKTYELIDGRWGWVLRYRIGSDVETIMTGINATRLEALERINQCVAVRREGDANRAAKAVAEWVPVDA